MRVLIIMPWIRQGGAELIAAQSALELQKKGQSVRIVALFKDLSQMDPRYRKIDYVTFKKPLSSFFQCSVWGRLLLGTGALFVLAWREAGWAEVLLPQSLPAHFVAAIIGKLKGKRMVWVCNEPPERRRLGQVRLADWLLWELASGRVERWAGKQASEIIVYSQLAKDEVWRRYRVEAMIIRPGLDFNFFSQRVDPEAKKLREKYGLKGKRVLLMVGRLDPQKNQALAIEVLKTISTHFDMVKLVFVGDGPDKKRLQKMVERMRLVEQVVFAGFGSPMIVRSWYAVADLILYPSQLDGTIMDQSWGLVPFEALCQQKLTVVSQASGAAEVLEEKRIGLVSPPTETAFSQAVLAFFSQPDKYRDWAKRGQAWVRSGLTWAGFGTRLNDLIIRDKT